MASNSIVKWKSSARTLMEKNPKGFKVLNTFCCLLEYIHINDWQGACHASSTVFSLLLAQQGIQSTIYLGEVSLENIYFDHSWVEVDDKIYDAAISNTLIRQFSLPPVFRGYDLLDNKVTKLQYGTPSGKGYDESANWIRNTTVKSYMELFPDHPDGLFGIAKIIGKNLGIRANKDVLRKQATHIYWTEKS